MTEQVPTPAKAIRHLLLLWTVGWQLLFALWWGGITFYALAVVPIGTELIGSTEQGFITQQVTWWHNWLASAMCLCIIIEAAARQRLVWWLLSVAMTLVVAALLVVHCELTSMLDFESRSTDDGFYDMHAIYLWLTAAEWLIGFLWIVMKGRH